MNCPFCTELATDLPPSPLPSGCSSRIILDSATFVVLVDYSPLTEGHVLVVPRRHLLSFGAIPASDHAELDRILQRLTSIMERKYGAVTIMEHGSSKSMDSGSCIAHAHLQIVPVGFNILPALDAYNPREIQSLADLNQWAASDKEYIFLRTSNGSHIVADSLAGVPRQFIRQVIGDRLGLTPEQWDWRITVREQCFYATLAAFAECHI
jgi:diadenosine tetraphosphate (Ap4A) HIT family hydrolase